MPTESDCLFCSFVADSSLTSVVGENEFALAFRDIDPKAPVHVLVIPKAHFPNVAAVAQSDPAVLAAMVELGQQVASREADGQFRLIFNSGAQAGQSVFHAHGHVLAGSRLGWNPA